MQHGVIEPTGPQCAPTDVPFLSARFKDAGYQTHLTGKWHLGGCSWNCTPTERGFDSFVGLLEAAGDFYSHRIFGGYDWWNGTQLDGSVVGEYTTDLIKEQAVNVINNYNEGDSPMFMWVTFTAPHTPLQAPQEYIDMYPSVEGDRQTYLAMVTAMDDAIGEIVDSLKNNGLWNDTFFLFSSDNGGQKGGWADNSPMRGGKGTLFEGGSRVAAFVSGPMLANPGTTNDGLIHVTDWSPTFLTMAGVEYDEEYFDGVDQSKMFTEGCPSERDEMIYNIDIEYTGRFFYGNAAIRKGDMKMIWGFPGMCDGYGLELADFYHLDEYLAYINLTYADYTDIPEERPHPFWKSPQEIANTFAIVEEMGIHGITEAEMDAGRGPVLYFNLAADPNETNNLAGDPQYAAEIYQLKEEIMTRIQTTYLPTPNVGKITMPDESSPINNPPLYAWVPGWCEHLSQSTVDWAAE